MKGYFALFLFLFLLVACMQVPTITQTAKNISEPVVNATQESQAVQNVSVQTQAPKIQTPVKPKTVILTTSNVTISSQDAEKIYSLKGKEYRIEVVDVTESQDGCLIKVNGVTDLIDKGSSKKINGLEIDVLDVYAMRSNLMDNDICQLIVH
jgi:hypothetical protein